MNPRNYHPMLDGPRPEDDPGSKHYRIGRQQTLEDYLEQKADLEHSSGDDQDYDGFDEFFHETVDEVLDKDFREKLECQKRE